MFPSTIRPHAHRPARSWVRSTVLLALAAFGWVPVHANADAFVGLPCLWAGASYRDAGTVDAGGWSFTCHTDGLTAWWDHAAAPGRPDTVPSPGADSNATNAFSLGAWQPGTSFFDYCVADSVMPGAAYVFQAVPYNGGVYWTATAPISAWTIPPSQHHHDSWYATRYCINGLPV